MGYEKALVIFIDILGSQERQDFDELYKINSKFHNELESNQSMDMKHTVYERYITSFSDCAYIIYHYKNDVGVERKDDGKLFNVALANTERVIQAFLYEGFICRGGISYGDVYFERNRNILFGPAVNVAYQLESGVAVYPRIIVDQYVAREILALDDNLDNKSDNLNNLPDELRQKIIGLKSRLILQDDDGQYYFNYLDSVSKGINYDYSQELINRNLKLCDNQMNYYHQRILDAVCKDEIEKYNKIIKKYVWLKDYLMKYMPKIDSGIISIPFKYN